MAFNFLEAVKAYFGNEMISKASSYLGEPDSQVRKGIDTIVPTALAGIINKVHTGNPESVMNFAKEAYDSGFLNQLSDSFRVGGEGVPAAGPALISSIFGDRFGAMANAVTDFTGIKGSTASALFGTIVPLALGLLGKHSTENNLTPGGLASLLGSQKAAVLHSLPPGFNLSRVMGWDGSTPHAVSTATHSEVEATGRNKMFMPFLFGVVGILLLLILMRTCDMHPEEKVATTEETPKEVKHEAPKSAKESVKLKLPNGVELDAYKGGIEESLINFINDPNSQPGKDNWFDFNDLNFEFGTAQIIPESRKEIDNIVKILQAYPKVKIKVGGYTDKVGDEAANKKLSTERANAVSEALKAAGVGAQVTAAEGYGSEFAKYPADAAEDLRIKDRRVSVSVREK